jgi:hypothetical protein
MRALWSIFTIAMSSWVKSKDDKRNWCEGCLKVVTLQDKKEEDEYLAPQE